jgi:glycosyltransferase involved in cell wall biosynthesis
MIEGRDIICFANDWDSDPLSKKHVMTRLARHNRVLWVNSLGVRNPTVSARDARRVWEKLRGFLRGCRQVEDNLWVFTPVVIPFHGSAFARSINRRLLAFMLRRVCRRLGFERPITWSFVPSSSGVVGRLGEQMVLYQCVDEYSEFRGADKVAILRMERELVERSDLVIVSSEPLLDAKRRFNPATHLVTHGVEVDHFRRACDPGTAVPEALQRLPRPVIGFFGLLADWVDLELIRRLAIERPAWSIVMIGKIDTDVSALRPLPNVHLLGPQPYATLPAYCKGFDVALVPFVVNELTLAANPLKMREYLAAGLPVISTDLPEARRLTGLVRIAHGHGAFIAAIEEVLESGGGPRASVSAAMDRESWDAKVEEMCRLVAGAAPSITGKAARECLAS